MPIKVPSTLQLLLLKSKSWWRYFQLNKTIMREAVVDNMIKVLSCGNTVRGYKKYECANPNCNHTKIVTFSCKSRFCSTCGKVATDQWIQTQKNILPDTQWQHITFTMPSVLWPCFKQNRNLLNALPKLAAQTIKRFADKQGIQVGMFAVLHTFGHDLKWNVHVHLSVTMGGLTQKQNWKKIRFARKAIMPVWRYKVISFLRKQMKKGTLKTSNKFLDQEYRKYWIVHLAKPTKTARHTATYLGRYLKRPPLPLSRLLHYSGTKVLFKFINRNDNLLHTTSMETHTFLEKLTQHIPEKDFRMVRYYGFLANHVRSKLLPIVYELINHIHKTPLLCTWRANIKRFLDYDPLKCILCGTKMIFSNIQFGLKKKALSEHHFELAHAKIINL